MNSPMVQNGVPASGRLPPFNPMSSASPNFGDGQMAIYHGGQQFASPSPLTTSPYPVPISAGQSHGSTEYIDRATEKQEEMAEFRKWRAMQRQQQAQQQQVQMRCQAGPPAAMPRNPQYVQQPFPLPQMHNDSGYGSGTFENYGQFQAFPGQRPQAYAAKPGHKYGNVVASGNSRVVRGNVIDRTAPNMLERQHEYGDATSSDKARVFDGNVTSEDMKGFWNHD
ncbi:hypothetical protein LTS08_006451 [Lithohypha guttulata]|uniref:Uncharacterized protein n=1 Tax=Lithohypha guttulata TaxID=1690604 RepID=A0AAN7T1V2_9EURO|nr:hypothetical protein LTR05_005249 [Lithohypha guttulata]KAK5098318.1 hypothetical protein LTS08_006451 [Lithohypha guttulata]